MASRGLSPRVLQYSRLRVSWQNIELPGSETQHSRGSENNINELNMDLMGHHDHVPMADPHVRHGSAPAAGAHNLHAGHSVAMFRDKFWLSLALTIPVVFWSTDIQHWLGYTAPTFPGSKFIPPILGTVVFVYGGLVFIRGAWGELPTISRA